jgi:hypothetical protein
VIFYHLWRQGMWRRLDGEKWRYFWGLTGDRLFLSRAWPLWRSLHLGRLLFRPHYAAAAATWIRYRADLYDGRTG